MNDWGGPTRRGAHRAGVVRASALLSFAVLTACATGSKRELRVCADPNNLPFSNRAEEGFENRLAELVADDLDAEVRYTWWPQRRAFVRNTLNAGKCDLVMGVPADFERVLTTRPYYRSTFAFVTRSGRGLRIDSLGDPRLRTLRIGVQVIGDDYTNTPPVHALSARGVVGNLTGYRVLGDYAEPNPPARIMDAVASGEVDVAIVWGPLAGYFATREPVALDVVPVAPEPGPAPIPLAFDIAMGVRRGDEDLRRELEGVLTRREGEIHRILDDFGVLRVPARRAGEAPRADAAVR